MSNGKYLYHNEVIGLIAILSVMRYAKQMSYAKSMLILPLAMHRSTVSFLKNKKVKVRGIEELVARNPSFFSGFKERYSSLLPISLNSIMILSQLKLIKIEDGEITYIESDFYFSDERLGYLALDIIQCSEKISYMLKGEAGNLYLQLRVEL